MEMNLRTSLAITTTALLLMHHLLLTKATSSIADHTTPNASSSPVGSITFRLVASSAVRRHTDGFLHLQHDLSHAHPPSSGTTNNDTSLLLPDTNTPEGLLPPRHLRMPHGLVLEFGSGTGRQTYTLKIENNEVLLPWIQCKECHPMAAQQHPLFDPAASPTFQRVPGESQLCGPPYGTPVVRDGRSICAFELAGPRMLLVKGFISEDQVTQLTQVIPQYLFGCVHETYNFVSHGVFAGAISLAATPASLVTQLASRGLTRFSYCLSGGSEETKSRRQGFLRFFSPGVQQLGPRFKTTKILPSAMGGGARDSEYYHLDLVGVSLGTRRLDKIRPEMFARTGKDGQGGGGCVIDLSASLTVMVHEAYNVIEEAVWSELERHGAELVKHASFGLCFRVTGAVKGNLPPLSLHFSEEDAVMEFSPEQLFLMMCDELGQIACLAMEPGHRTVIGTFQQVNIRFVYDVKENRLSFAPESCIEDTTAQVD